jgi:hypothetical protein
VIDRAQVCRAIVDSSAGEEFFGAILDDGTVLPGTMNANPNETFGFYFAVDGRNDRFSTTHQDLLRMDKFGAAYVRVGVENGRAKWFRADRLGRTPRGEKFLVPIWPPETV